MKNISLLIFISLISIIFSDKCSPAYHSDSISLESCSKLDVTYSENECCVIYYTGNAEEPKTVCYEMTAKIMIHFSDYKQAIKDEILKNSPGEEVVSINDFECSSKYLKFALISLLLFFF